MSGLSQMRSLVIDRERCTGCKSCIKACRRLIFAWDQGGKCPQLREDRLFACMDCGHCTAVCPAAAITLDGIDPATLDPLPSGDPRMLPARDILRMRRSMADFKPDPVPRALIEEAILDAGYAPTSRGERTVHWTVLNSRAYVESILQAMLPSYRDSKEALTRLRYEDYEAGFDSITKSAPCVIMAHTDVSRPSHRHESNCMIATTYLTLALELRGLASCWSGRVEKFAQAEALSVLSLPKGHKVFTALFVGYSSTRFRRYPWREPAPLAYFD